MKLLLTLLATLALGGCANNCTHACIMGFGPGNSVFNTVADNANRGDPCQTAEFSSATGQRLKPAGHTPPDYCKYRTYNRTTITDRNGRTLGYIK